MMTILYFLLALLGLGVLVFIHELGHYFVARWVGMKVEIFSIGFGKPLVKWKSGGVDWQLAMLPFGGFVKIAGTEFGKKDQYGAVIDPYQVEGGFFQKSPLKRMAVAFAGPFANFILALVLFGGLYALGGREKPFSEYTHIIGWVDPQSDSYAQGIRPGDQLTTLNGRPYTTSKDLLYAAMSGGQTVEVKGFHIDYATGDKKPFSYHVHKYLSPLTLEDLYTTGVLSGARYLIYDRLRGEENPLMEGSPMEKSGISYQDRLVWADGYPLFSMDQLSYILNDGRAYLTVKRKDMIFHSRQKRFLAGDLIIPSHIRSELQDWQYEAGMKGKWQQLMILPYVLSADATVVDSLNFVDEECKKIAFGIEEPLQAGDRIIGVDGVPITTAYQLLDLLQTKHVSLIVEKGISADTILPLKQRDTTFFLPSQQLDIETIAQTIGTTQAKHESGPFVLLSPIEPKKLDQFTLSEEKHEKIQQQYEDEKLRIGQMQQSPKRTKMLETLEKERNKVLLGLSLQDATIDYNPSAFTSLKNAFSETWLTLKALIFGYLNPKWLAGPIGIVQVISHGWKTSVGEAIFWMGAISVNLGVLNLLPIPVLDGGYITLSLWEMVTRRRLKPRTIERLIVPFVVLLIGLLIFLTFQDVTRLFR